MTVGGVFADLLAHPWRRLVGRWNWKAATLSTAIRGGIFFATSLGSGFAAASRALAVDVTFRVPTVGLYAAVVQAFASATPPWAATAIAAALVPAVSHAVEFAVHRAAGTPGRSAGVIASVAFSAVSSAFELFAMRHGALIVGPGASPLSEDLARLPRLVGTSLAAAGRSSWRWAFGR